MRARSCPLSALLNTEVGKISNGEADGRLKLRAGTARDFWKDFAYDQEGIADFGFKKLAARCAIGFGWRNPDKRLWHVTRMAPRS